MKKHVWQETDLAKSYLEGIRGGIPLAAEQLDVILRIVTKVLPTLDNLLDVGCGDGILGRAVMDAYPEARGTFVDFSEHMLAQAQQKTDANRSNYHLADLSEPTWAKSAQKSAPFDLVLSGLAIHHQPDARKRSIYAEIFDLLKPGGLFLHLEHTESRSSWAKEVFEEYFVDSLWNYHRREGGTKPREEIANEFYGSPGRAANILSPVDLQTRWLEEIGFVDVECFFKIFEISIFGGRKP
jgi:tRNA (cmo5U34)-methyltransferase